MHNNRPILVFGILGQVGSALMTRLGERAIGLTPADADFTNPSCLPAVLDRFQPSAVINAAAYTQVDQAEKEKELVFKLNAESPGVLARWCAEHDVPFVHYSTDYVYPGIGTEAWNEDSKIGPLNTYGESKAEGDHQVMAAGGQYLIFRTSWVYDATGKNFVKTMLKLAQEREELRVVSDQWGAPTYAGHIADGTLQALEKALAMPKFPSGVYHLCNSGCTNWHEFALAIFEEARKKSIALKIKNVVAIPASAYPTPAQRPENSRLSLEKIQRVFGFTPPDWKDGLHTCMKELP